MSEHPDSHGGVLPGVVLQDATDSEPALAADIYLASTLVSAPADACPVVILLCGAFAAAEEYSCVASYLAGRGWIVLVPQQYHPSPFPGVLDMLKEPRDDGKVNMVKAACILGLMQWLQNDAVAHIQASHPGAALPDTSNVFLLGHSAGAFTASLILAQIRADKEGEEHQKYAQDPNTVPVTLPYFSSLKGALLYGFAAWRRFGPLKDSWLPLHARNNQPTLSLSGELDDLREYQKGTTERHATPCASVTIKGCDHLSMADRNYFKKYTMQKRLCATPLIEQHRKLFPAINAGLEALNKLACGEDSSQIAVASEDLDVLETCGDAKLLQCWVGHKSLAASAVLAG